LVALALFSGVSRLEQTRLQQTRLEYAAPEGCGSRTEVLTKLAEILGRDPAELPPIEARIGVESTATYYVLSYQAEFQGARSERTLELQSCAAVVEAAALLLAISVDPSLNASLDAPEPAPTDLPSAPPKDAALATALPATVAPSAAADADAPVPSPDEPPPRRERKKLSGFVGAAVSGSSSLTPTFALGGGLSVGARLGAFSFGIKSFIEATPVPGQPSADVSVSALLWRNRGWGGATFPVGPLRLGPYLGLGVEVLQVWASGLSSGGSGASPLLSAAAGGMAVWSLGPSWALEIDGGLTVPFERPSFLVNGLESPVHRPGAVSADITFGVNWSFGSQ
jgi:hypothetical protein